MSDSVAKLKELLFEPESAALGDLAMRLDSVLKSNTELNARVSSVFERVGTNERLRSSVASVLDGAMRDAEVEKHHALSEAMSPLVVTTVRTEIRNSRDELVEALYPMTGRMVKAYVASAMKDLANDINRRLEKNAFMLRLQSLTTGRSVAELAMAGSQKLEVEELYLIRRGSGALVAAWPESAVSGNRNQVMSGVLTAITEFANQAFEPTGNALRQIDLGEAQVYLRMSPAHLLAAKCTGTAHTAIENVIDETFLSAIEQQGEALRRSGPSEASAGSGLLSHLAETLPKRIAEEQAAMAVPGGVSPLAVLAWLFGLPIAAWIGWTVYTNVQTARVRSIAERIIAAETDLKGFPTGLDVGQRGRSVTVKGLAPSQSLKDNLFATLKVALPSSLIQDDMAVLPAAADARPDVAILRRDVSGAQKVLTELGVELSGARRDLNALERSAVSVALERVARDLDATQADLKPLAADPQLQGHSEAQRVSKVVNDTGSVVSRVLASLATQDKTAAGKLQTELSGLKPLTGQIQAATAALEPLLPAPPAGRSAAPKRNDASKVSLNDAEDLAVASNRLSSIALAVAQGAALRRMIPPPAVPIAAGVVTPREHFRHWTRENAVFFAQNVDFRNEGTAGKTLDDAARLMIAADGIVRIIGYTDELGSQGRNSTIGQARAEKVFGELTRRGVPPERLVVLSRSDANDISPNRGTGSPNRRVQFELGFDGELTP